LSAFKEIVVTVEVTYLIPMMKDGTRTEINGWTIEEVARDWFDRYDINSSHATRDSHRLGNGTRILGWRVATLSGSSSQEKP
jgi:hypothetical protein